MAEDLPVDNLSTTHSLMTRSWKTDVEALDTAMRTLATGRRLTNECRVAFFEIAGDRHLHVNVTHRHCTEPVPGWAGPATTPAGFVHNRRFAHSPAAEIIQQVRDMVLAPRLWA
jgi:hypothetical protein